MRIEARGRAWRFVPALVLAFFVPILARPARGAAPPVRSEYEVKAAFLFNFTKFVTWPPAAFASAQTPLTIGVLGTDPFGSELERNAEDLKVQGRPLKIIRGSDVVQLATCHLIFISASEHGREAEILSALRQAHSTALTVGETSSFLQAGGMIRFVIEENKVRFEINPEPAAAARLAISSKLLTLARNSRPGHS